MKTLNVFNFIDIDIDIIVIDIIINIIDDIFSMFNFISGKCLR